MFIVFEPGFWGMQETHGNDDYSGLEIRAVEFFLLWLHAGSGSDLRESGFVTITKIRD